MIRKSVKRFSLATNAERVCAEIMRKQEAKARCHRALAGNVTDLVESRRDLKNPLAIMWMERFAVMQRTSNEMTQGEIFKERLNSMGEGMLMPAFSFEKISPAAPGAAEAPTPTKIDEKTHKKPRGVIVQVLDRIAGARARRGQQKRPARS